MKVEIDTDDLLHALNQGPCKPEVFSIPHSHYAEGYLEGRLAAAQAIAGMLGVTLSFDVDTPTFRQFLYFGMEMPEEKKEAA